MNEKEQMEKLIASPFFQQTLRNYINLFYAMKKIENEISQENRINTFFHIYLELIKKTLLYLKKNFPEHLEEYERWLNHAYSRKLELDNFNHREIYDNLETRFSIDLINDKNESIVKLKDEEIIEFEQMLIDKPFIEILLYLRELLKDYNIKINFLNVIYTIYLETEDGKTKII